MPSSKSEPQGPSIAHSNSSSGLHSSDGQGGGPSGGKQLGEATSPRYLYYRLYTKDGAIESYNPIYSNDPFTSRILPKSLTPPHTAFLLKKHLCKIEGFPGSSAILFESLSSNAALNDTTHLKLCSHLGVSSREPMALVVTVAEAERRPQSWASGGFARAVLRLSGWASTSLIVALSSGFALFFAKILPSAFTDGLFCIIVIFIFTLEIGVVLKKESRAIRSLARWTENKSIKDLHPREKRYIYYRVYDEEGEVNSKTAFDKSDICLGRVDTLSVAPPYTLASLKSRIAKVEGIAGQEIQLFKDTNGEVLIKDTDRAHFFAETFPGCVEDDPLAVVYGLKTPSSTSTMTKAIPAKYNGGPNDGHSVGEVLHTNLNGATTGLYTYSGGVQSSYMGSMAANLGGREAFVQAGNFNSLSLSAIDAADVNRGLYYRTRHHTRSRYGLGLTSPSAIRPYNGYYY